MRTKVKNGTSTGARAAPPKPPRPGKAGAAGRTLTMNLPHQEPGPRRCEPARPNDAGRLPLPCQMIAEASRHVVGQPRAIQAVAAALYRHFLLLSRATESGLPPRPGRVLLVGPTGVGKTLLIKALAKFVGAPFVYISATTLVQSGYVGKKPEDILFQLLQAAGGDIERAQRGIVLLDEVDKLKRNDDVFGLDVSGYGAQVDLLTFLDGSDVTVQRDNMTYHFNTRGVFVVSAGAFEGLERITERRLQEGAGFGFGTPGTGSTSQGGGAEDLLAEDLVSYGLCEEFVGRFSVLAKLDPLGAADLKTILLKARGSALAEAQEYFKLHGVELEFDEAALDAIVARAIKQGTGARALPRLLHAVLADTEWQLPELAGAGVGAVSVALVDGELKVRWREVEPAPSRAEQLRAEARPARGAAATPRAELAQVSDTRGWSEERIRGRLEMVKRRLGWDEVVPGSPARRWWELIEHENRQHLGPVLRVAETLATREGATISEFHLAWVFSKKDDVEEVLLYFDEMRLKKRQRGKG